MGASQSDAFGCGSSDGLPCCTRNSSTSADIVRSRPVGYSSAKDQSPLSGKDLASNKLEVDTLRSTVAQNVSDADAMPEETYEDGSTYKGELADGRRHGRGTWTSTSEQYEGQWLYDQRDGKGKQTWQDGRMYDGEFRGGKFHGQGRMEWHTPNGLMLYEGQYVDDVKHGHGKYVWHDNRMYEGQWKDGMREGLATYTNPLGQCRRGEWKDDKVVRWLDEEHSQGALPKP
eukprot:TRINITY_DN88118_c0_g1_i1.p1 TRINITY_DN88118_c0_g1~~TRINITY_DN88118_c0_g1_i1.p1  ORF type:complete len:237 (-),score=23.29 TRINITY_DN88118_c0_g1_i1:23-712(-)